jgi:hypothetical protein
MVASKVLFEATYHNQSWSIVAQKMFPLKEINQMEREMLAYLGRNVSIQCEDMVEFEARIRQQYGFGADAASSPCETVTNATGNASI